VDDAMQNMLERQQDVFYYLTAMNENYVHPALPAGAEEGILRGMYLLRPGREGAAAARVQLLGSGTILREALAAADLLENDWGITANVWSVTSFTELRRTALEIERANRLQPATEKRQLNWVESCLGTMRGPVVAATDYVRAVADLIRAWVPGRYVTLGTDGFGRSDTRAALRRFFEVDRTSIAFAAIRELIEEGSLDASIGADFIARYDYQPPALAPWCDRRDGENAHSPATVAIAK
jgi:pyruvate dehydrogenase E1 component